MSIDIYYFSEQVLSLVINVFVCIAATRWKLEWLNVDLAIVCLSVLEIVGVVLTTPFQLTSQITGQWYGSEVTCYAVRLVSAATVLISLPVISCAALFAFSAAKTRKDREFKEEETHYENDKKTISFCIGGAVVIGCTLACLQLFDLCPSLWSGEICHSWLFNDAVMMRKRELVFRVLVLVYFVANCLVTCVACVGCASRLTPATRHLDDVRIAPVMSAYFVVSHIPLITVLLLRLLDIQLSKLHVHWVSQLSGITPILLPVIYALVSNGYRYAYWELLRSISRWMFGCPLSRLDRVRAQTKENSTTSFSALVTSYPINDDIQRSTHSLREAYDNIENNSIL